MERRWKMAWYAKLDGRRRKLSWPNMNLIQQQPSSTGAGEQGVIENKMVEQPSCSRQSSQDDVDCSSAVGVKPSGRFLYSIHFIVWFFCFSTHRKFVYMLIWSWTLLLCVLDVFVRMGYTRLEKRPGQYGEWVKSVDRKTHGSSVPIRPFWLVRRSS